MLGIDVSQHQGNIDWEKVKGSGIKFALLRMGFGSDIPNQTDTTVLKNAKECDRLGIPYGLYIYSYALDETNTHLEAQHMIRIAKQTNATLGYWYDMEDADQYKEKHNFAPRQHKTELTNFCKIFMEDMKKAGYDNVGVYANYDYFKNVLDFEKLRKCGKIWLAHWGIKTPSLECNVWQYTSSGKVDGISGNVDMNILYDDIANEGGTETQEQFYDKPEFTLRDSLEKIGIDSSLEYRGRIAMINGIKDYKGTAEQNIYMLQLLNEGKLKKL